MRSICGHKALDAQAQCAATSWHPLCPWHISSEKIAACVGALQELGLALPLSKEFVHAICTYVRKYEGLKGCLWRGRREPSGYMPWGEGPRKCLGMPLARAEMRVSTPFAHVHCIRV